MSEKDKPETEEKFYVEPDLSKRLALYHQQIILIVGFIGALVFAGLILVVGNPTFILSSSEWPVSLNPRGYLDLMAGLLAFVAGLSVMTVIMSLRALTIWFKSVKGAKRMYGLIEYMVATVFVVFETSLFLILAPEGVVLALGVFVFLGALFVVVNMQLLSSHNT